MTELLNSELYLTLADGGFFYAIAFIAVCAIAVVVYDFASARASSADMAQTAKKTTLVVLAVSGLGVWYIINIQYGTLAYLSVMLPPSLGILAVVGGFIPSGLQAYYILVERWDGEHRMKEFTVAMIDVVANVMGMLASAGVHPVDSLSYAIQNPLQVVTMTLLSLVGNFLVENLGVRAIVRYSMIGEELRKFMIPKGKKTDKLPTLAKRTAPRLAKRQKS